MSSKFEVKKTSIDTVYGTFDFFCFSWGSHEEDNILCLYNSYEGVPNVRVQSACYTAEIFRSLDCDCHEQLHKSQELISEKGGLLIYMLCDGRGAGLLKKVEGLEMWRSEGVDTSDAYRKMGLKQDPREYDRVTQVLEYFSINELNLLTNNPRKVEGLERAGVKVHQFPLEIKATDHSEPYLKTKATKMGHTMTQFNSDN